jgi:hypothetical protein
MNGSLTEKKMAVKTYVVLQRVHLPKAGEPPVKVLAVKLTHAAAQEIVDALPGTYIEKHIATK